MAWSYPTTGTANYYVPLDENGIIVTKNSGGTPAKNKKASFKNFKTPTNGEESDGAEAINEYVLGGVFGFNGSIYSANIVTEVQYS